MPRQLDGDDGRAAGRAVDAELPVDRLHPLEQTGKPAPTNEKGLADPSSATVSSSPPFWSLTPTAARVAPLCLATLARSSAARK